VKESPLQVALLGQFVQVPLLFQRFAPQFFGLHTVISGFGSRSPLQVKPVLFAFTVANSGTCVQELFPEDAL
jgi:hypothetical protein